MPVLCQKERGKRKSTCSRDPAYPRRSPLAGFSRRGAWPSRISLPPFLPLSPSLLPSPLPRLPRLPLSLQRCWRGVALAAAGNSCPRLAPLPRLRLIAPTSRLSEFQNSGGGPRENRSRCDAFRRPHPAGTDLLISRTAGRRELNCCLPLLSCGWWLVF